MNQNTPPNYKMGYNNTSFSAYIKVRAFCGLQINDKSAYRISNYLILVSSSVSLSEHPCEHPEKASISIS